MADILLVGDSGAIRRTTNYGSSWTVPYSGSEDIISICPVGNGVVFALSLNGILFKSIDDGQNWANMGVKITEQLYSPSSSLYVDTISKLVYIGNNTLITIGGAYPATKVFRSTDLGVSWGTVYTSLYKVFTCCEGFVNGEIFVLRGAPTIRSVDYGVSWGESGGGGYRNLKKTGDGYLVTAFEVNGHYFLEWASYASVYNSFTETISNVLLSYSSLGNVVIGTGVNKVTLRASDGVNRSVSPYLTFSKYNSDQYRDYGYLSSYLFAISTNNVYSSIDDGASYTSVYATGTHNCITTYNTGVSASFTGAPTSGVLGTSVQFTDASVGAISWDWNYGDGSIHGTSQNPAHIYSSAGTYTVILSINSGESVYTRTAFITIIPATNSTKTKINYISVNLHADFTGDRVIGASPLLTHFTDSSLGVPTSWEWDFGDGSSVIRSQNPQHYYMSPGTYNVTLTVYRGALSATITKSAYILVSSYTLDFVGTPRSGEAPLSVQFNNTSVGISPTSVSWDFGDGGTGTGDTPTHNYNDVGTFPVEMTVRVDP